MLLSYRLSGQIEVPDGSRINKTGSGVILPNGKEIKIWEQLEISTPGEDDHRNLEYDELEGMGIFYDGDCCEFDHLYDAAEIAKLNTALEPKES